MNRTVIEKHFGPTWVDLVAPFADSPEMDKILATLKQEKQSGIKIFPDVNVVFRAFRECPLPDVRVVIIGQDPYPREGYANGLAFGHEKKAVVNNVLVDLPTAPSLATIIDAVEKDCYGGLNFDKPNFDTSLIHWAKQGVLLLNAALTVRDKEPKSHQELWKDFVRYTIDRLCEVKKDLIFLCWGDEAVEMCKNVNVFLHKIPAKCEHPASAARKKVAWDCNHFSFVNAFIMANRKGDLIVW